MKWFVVLLISSSFAQAGCKEITIEGEALCHDEKSGQFLSKGCESVKSCFPFEGKFRVLPTQSPGFTMCYDMKGEPFFFKLEGQKTSLSFCRKGGKTVDIKSLLKTYGPRREG